MFDVYAEGERRGRFLGRILLSFVAVGGLGYFLYIVSPQVYGVAAPSLPRPNVRIQAADQARLGRFDREPPRFAQDAPGFPGGGDIALVAQFDRDGDGRLNATERRAAREALSQMPRRRRFGRLSTGPTDPGPSLTPPQVRSYPDAPLYDTSVLRTIFLQFEDADWEAQLIDFHRTDVELPATLIIDGKTYRDVGVHFRGNSSFSGVPAGRKHSMQLTLDWVHDEQNLYGYRTLNLYNANQDPTFQRIVLYNDIARDYIPAPKANFVRVVINGESWGIYPNAQVFNKDFVRDAFKTTKGARWRAPGNPRSGAGLQYVGDDPAPYKRMFEIKTKDDPKSWADLINLAKVLNETPLDKLEAALAPILDIDGVLKFLAIDNALINSDGYWARASDYNIYQDERGRFHFFTHDFNETLGPIEGRGFRGGVGARPGTYELDPLIGLDDAGKPLRSRLLAVPALRERYLGYVRDIAERWLDWKKLGPIVERYQSLIAPDIRTDVHRLYDSADFDAVTGDSSIKAFADARRTYLLEYLSTR